MIRRAICFMLFAPTAMAQTSPLVEKPWPAPQASWDALKRSDYKLAERITEGEISRCEAIGGTVLATSRRCFALYAHMQWIASRRGSYDRDARWEARMRPWTDEFRRLQGLQSRDLAVAPLIRARAFESEGDRLRPSVLDEMKGATSPAALARYRAAEAIYREEIARARRSGDQANLEIYHGLAANLSFKQKRDDDAVAVIREGLHIWSDRLPKADRHLANATSLMAAILSQMNRHAEAEPYYRALVPLRALQGLEDKLFARRQLALNLWEQRRFNESIATSAETLELTRSIYGEISIETMRWTANLGVSYGLVGDFRSSEALLREAKRIERQWLVLPVAPDTERYKALGFDRTMFNAYLKAAWLLSREQAGEKGRWPAPTWVTRPD